jgi:UDP-N-acetylmuramoylalanine--D-glutamate ligase
LHGFLIWRKNGIINVMDIQDLRGKMVAVLGFGMEGRATTKYLIKHGVSPVLFDARPWDEWSTDDQNYIKSLKINFIFGPDYLQELRGFDVAFRSPGIKLSDVKGHMSNVAIITSQTKWFFDYCPGKIIGVTGTKGKGTTCTLIYNILKQAGKSVYLVGNIGETQPFEILDNLSPDDLIVYEMSSFQLQDLTKSPHVGVVLMTTSEHLDYHKDVEEYRQAKEQVVKFQTADDFAIYNEDYEGSANIGKLGNGQKISIGAKQDLPFDVSKIQLNGVHNLENIKAAVAVAKVLDIAPNVIQKSVEDFKGLIHRLEFVTEKNGVKFYNDSFSTTPETAIAAIKAFEEPEIIILGGSSKNSNFTDLGKTILERKNIQALILIGQEAERIEKSLIGQFMGKILRGAKNMEEIFEQIRSVAKSGDVVLLSPACASFGMFKNYKDRGEQFKKIILKTD